MTVRIIQDVYLLLDHTITLQLKLAKMIKILTSLVKKDEKLTTETTMTWTLITTLLKCMVVKVTLECI